MSMNNGNSEKLPTRFQRAMSVAGIVVSSPVIWLGLTGLFLVSGSLILNDTRTRLDFWFVHLCIALLSALLIYGGYRFESSARRSRVPAETPQMNSPGWFLGLFKRRKFGPLSASPVGIFVAIGLVAGLAVVVSAPRGPLARELIAEALFAGIYLRNQVTEFHQERRRLPQASEAAAFEVSKSALGSKHSVAWDPGGRRIVITAGEPEPGKRFALYAEERGGSLHWTCRTIDLSPKYLPANCR